MDAAYTHTLTQQSDHMYHLDIKLFHPWATLVVCVCVCVCLGGGAMGRCVTRSNLTVIPRFLKLYDGEQQSYRELTSHWSRPPQGKLTGKWVNEGHPLNKHFTECFPIHPSLKSTCNKKQAGCNYWVRGMWHWGMKSTCYEPRPPRLNWMCVFWVRSAVIFTFLPVLLKTKHTIFCVYWAFTEV